MDCEMLSPKSWASMLMPLISFKQIRRILWSLYTTSFISHASPLFEEMLVKTSHIEIGRNKMSLINFNPHVNRWLMLEIQGEKKLRIHLENPFPEHQVSLTMAGLELHDTKKTAFKKDCPLWTADKLTFLEDGHFSKYQNPYFPICDGLLYIRLQRSSKTKLSLTEWGTEALRKTNFGEDIINAVKPTLVELDAEKASTKFESTNKQVAISGAPQPADSKQSTQESKSAINTNNSLGIELKVPSDSLTYGLWYETKLHPHIYVSLFIPELVPEHYLESFAKTVSPISQPELDKLVYSVAYDLSIYTALYAIGTEQPPIDATQANSGDFFAQKKSLISIGEVPPYDIASTVGVFIGGFKRQHSEIFAGPHKGKVYGYIQNGVELSPMAPGLATLSTSTSGDVYLRAWPDSPTQQKSLREKTVSARQNGVLLIDNKSPSPLTNKWREGNWSANASGLGKSLRAGVCIQDYKKKKFLLFMAFTAATPSTMVRVMQAYQCSQAMHLDMNAYMYIHNMLFKMNDDQTTIGEYLHKEMQYPAETKEHRFILDNNSRDFFYVKKR